MEAASSITLRVDEETIDAQRDISLLKALTDAGLRVETACGGMATCHLCRVTITEGGAALSAPSRREQRALGNILISQGVRLSCQVKVTSPFSVKLPEYESPTERRRRKERARQKSKP
ncbi:MAG: 2Fe-2S iron-sulfur cluster-binding protein [Myxococcota bacterium]|nr:2Fe-2S iron-sulfur cluster-binding protein [Myxococcota bacterium]